MNSQVKQHERLPLKWQEDEFYDRDALNVELERVFDICHGCRRCVNLCNTFPTLFDLIDASTTFEVDGVDKEDYGKVVDECYLCDLCYIAKCPYVPPHEWNVDFPHLMQRAKSVKYREQGVNLRDKLLGATDKFGALASLPGVNTVVNAGIQSKVLRKRFKIHQEAVLPKFHQKTFRRRFAKRDKLIDPQHTVALFVSCYGNYNMPDMVEALCDVLEHNMVAVTVVPQERCCGMPKLEQGDLEAVRKNKEYNIPILHDLVVSGHEIIAPIPSCVLMFQQELPAMFPDDEQVAAVAKHIHDPTAWLLNLHKQGKLKTDFKNPLGQIAYHAACHTRVQNIGLKTPQLLELVPNTKTTIVERCSGHDGTYAIKAECHKSAEKIARMAVRKIEQIEKVDFFTSDCVLAGKYIAEKMNQEWQHPIELLAHAYGVESTQKP